MASMRLVSSLIRSSLRGSPSKPSICSPASRLSSSSSRASPYGYLLNRVANYGAAAPPPSKKEAGGGGEINEGMGAIGHVCHVIGSLVHVKACLVDVKFDEGVLPRDSTLLEVLDHPSRLVLVVIDDHLGDCVVRTITRDCCTVAPVRGWRVLNTGSSADVPIDLGERLFTDAEIEAQKQMARDYENFFGKNYRHPTSEPSPLDWSAAKIRARFNV